MEDGRYRGILKLQTTVEGLEFRVVIPKILEDQKETNMETGMETGIIEQFLGITKIRATLWGSL